ncbi:MAG TPA: ABC transporter substrate-binding protein [Pusillimonas sp.]|uniref:ABC transporter substrate-binding protein n=1 Tax=Pusillimonas sp. TaxID=3040095 RepID=UPI002CD36A77|nr:ABC transporter substrate-binding protein [Pusillimonas sp.]HUH87759.1 ABC transporter substrate-binding protein [Pusillimonas sp.]
MKRRQVLAAICAGAFASSAMLPFAAHAKDETVKVGLILSMTGPFASTGRQIEQGARLYLSQHGDTVAGKKIELIIKDDTGAPDHSRRVAQELVPYA